MVWKIRWINGDGHLWTNIDKRVRDGHWMNINQTSEGSLKNVWQSQTDFRWTSNESQTNIGRSSNGHQTKIRRTSDNVGRKSDEHQMKIKWMSTATTMALDMSLHKHLNTYISKPSLVVLLFCCCCFFNPNTRLLFSCLKSTTLRLTVL